MPRKSSEYQFLKSGSGKYFNMIDNYIYLHHLGQFIILPTYPDSISDTSSVQFQPETPMMRSAPIYSYSRSGPRNVGISLKMHREMMYEINYKRSNAVVEIGDDYVDTIIKHLQSMAYPKYSDAEKMVDPPIISMRFGDEIFIKGVVQGNVNVSYDLPIITDVNGKDKYAMVSVSFNVDEIEPYDASTVSFAGSFRGLNTSLERNLWKSGRSLSENVVRTSAVNNFIRSAVNA